MGSPFVIPAFLLQRSNRAHDRLPTASNLRADPLYRGRCNFFEASRFLLEYFVLWLLFIYIKLRRPLVL